MSKFKLFHIDKDFETEINKFCETNKIIKWEKMESKLITGAEIILVEYEPC